MLTNLPAGQDAFYRVSGPSHGPDRVGDDSTTARPGPAPRDGSTPGRRGMITRDGRPAAPASGVRAMRPYDFDLVCIGSGPAGQRAAVQAAKLGKRAAVIEKQRCVGGVCVDTGTIPSKTLREAVVLFSGLAARGDHRRLSSSHRPTAEMLLARVEEVVRRETEVVEDNYPTLAERYQVAALDAANKRGR
jgi:hypothetical protein